MQPHPIWNLSIHTTPELEQFLGETIAVRTHLHSWPLSAVEALTTTGGSRFIYKVQHEPSVEAEFLGQAHSRLLPTCRLLQCDSQQTALLLPFLAFPTLHDQGLAEADALAHGRALVREIAALGGGLPVYRDVGTLRAWREFAGITLAMLAALMRSGVFDCILADDLDFLTRWVEDRAVLEAIENTSQLIHGDLNSQHVFCAPDGYRIIDWQRPYRAPGEIDLVVFLESLEISPRPYVPPAVFGLRWFLFLHWAVEAKTNLLPDLPFYDQWARSGIDHIRSAGHSIS